MGYLRWGGVGEAVQPEKGSGVENCLKMPQNPQRQVHYPDAFWDALLACALVGKSKNSTAI
jgi:hypothetical protein